MLASRRNYFRRLYRLVAPTTDPQYLKTDRVPVGRRQVLQRVAAEDATSAATSLRFVVLRGSNEYPLSYQSAPAAGHLYWDSDPIVLTEGEQLAAVWVGPVAADVLTLTVAGFEVASRAGEVS